MSERGPQDVSRATRKMPRYPRQRLDSMTHFSTVFAETTKAVTSACIRVFIHLLYDPRDHQIEERELTIVERWWGGNRALFVRSLVAAQPRVFARRKWSLFEELIPSQNPEVVNTNLKSGVIGAFFPADVCTSSFLDRNPFWTHPIHLRAERRALEAE